MNPSLPTVAVIGAGFSGTVVAAHLLRSAGMPLRVILIDRSGREGRGVAYGTSSPRHVLNVPAGRMSAFVGDEDHFLRFAKGKDVSVVGGSFVPRRLYGDYLQATLRLAANQGAHRGSLLERRTADVADLVHDDAGGVQLHLTDGTRLAADRVIVALGNFAPANPPVPGSEAFYASDRYVRDPWREGALDTIPFDAPVALVGTGLTMLDVAVELSARGRTAPLHAISRRGLVPLSHRPHGAPPSYGHLPPELIACEPTAVAYLRAIRRHVRQIATDGIDWREVVASLRPVTPRLWETLSSEERRRFLRHARPYWDVHRHRVAPELHQVFEALRASGGLRLSAARVLHFAPDADGVDVAIRRRGTDSAETLRVAMVINCTGPESDVRAVGEPLLDALLARGTVRADASGLGLDVAPDGRLRRADGTPNPHLWLAGPLLKGAYWEATAVPELRVHAARAAKHALASLAHVTP